jgi:hypothetical protein
MNKAGIIPQPEGKGTFVHDRSEYNITESEIKRKLANPKFYTSDIKILEGTLYDECKIVSGNCHYTFFADTSIPKGQRIFVQEIALTFLGLSFKVEEVLCPVINDLFSAKLIYIDSEQTSLFEYKAVECFNFLTYYVTLKRRLLIPLLICAKQIFSVHLVFDRFPSVAGYTIRVNLFGVTERVV